MPTVITFDPAGDIHGLPTFPWQAAPAGMATRRQLSAQGLRPNGQDPAAQVLRPRRRRPPLVAYLYRVDLAAPKRPMTPARYAAVLAAVRARRVCQGPCGRRDLDYIPPDHNGRRCFDCEAAAHAKGDDH
jgi:hypothetical protein